MTVVEAAKKALERLAKPATTREIYNEIVRQKSFEFSAKDPVSVVGAALRRRTKGSKTLRGQPLFGTEQRGIFGLLPK